MDPQQHDQNVNPVPQPIPQAPIPPIPFAGPTPIATPMPIPTPLTNPQPVGVFPQAANPTQPTAPITFKQKIPVSVQILFGFSIVGLIFGVLAVLALLLLGTRATGSTFSAFGGIIYIFALLLAIIFGFSFFLVLKIHAGKQWALIVYSVFLGLSLLSNLVQNTSSSHASLVAELGTLALVIIMWTKDRHYFH